VNGAGVWIDRAAERAVDLGELRRAIGVLAALERARDGPLADAQPHVVANITSRGDGASGMHALAIQVDPAAYRAVKVEALQRGSSIPTVIGESLNNSRRDNRSPPRRRPSRVGAGRVKAERPISTPASTSKTRVG
jgi:hypothetical protein